MNPLKALSLPAHASVIAVAAIVITLLFSISSVSGFGHSLLTTLFYAVADRFGDFATWASGMVAQLTAE